MIFTLLISAISAWSQIFMLFMALIMLGIGGGIFAYVFFVRFAAKPIRARVKEVYVLNQANDDEEEVQVDSTKKTSFLGYVITLLIPLIFCGVGLYLGGHYFYLSTSGNYAQATVIRNDASSGKSGTTYNAVLQFQDISGIYYEVRDFYSFGRQASYEVGTILDIYYLPLDPKNFVIIDPWHSLTLPLLFFALGAFFIFLLLVVPNIQFKNRQVGNTRYNRETYYASYIYKLPNGEMAEYMDEGTGALIGAFQADQPIILRHFPRSGYTTRLGMMLPIVGFFFLGCGLFLLSMFIATFDNNPFVILFAVMGMLYMGFRARRAYYAAPPEAREKFKMFLSQLKNGKLDKSEFKLTASSQKNGRKLEAAEIKARVIAQDRSLLFSAKIGLFIGCALLIGGYYMAQDMRGRIENGVRVVGEVIYLEQRESGDDYTYHARIRYTNERGQVVEFSDSVGSSHPFYKRGDAVQVLYDPRKSGSAMIDRGIWNWALSGGLGLAGFLVLISSVRQMIASTRRRYVTRI